MPVMWLRAHLAAMPELQALEAFRASEIVALGAGKMDKAGRDRTIKRWRKDLGQEPPGTVVRLTGTRKDLELMKGLMGK